MSKKINKTNLRYFYIALLLPGLFLIILFAYKMKVEPNTVGSYYQPLVDEYLRVRTPILLLLFPVLSVATLVYQFLNKHRRSGSITTSHWLKTLGVIVLGLLLIEFSFALATVIVNPLYNDFIQIR